MDWDWYIDTLYINGIQEQKKYEFIEKVLTNILLKFGCQTYRPFYVIFGFNNLLLPNVGSIQKGSVVVVIWKD